MIKKEWVLKGLYAAAGIAFTEGLRFIIGKAVEGKNVPEKEDSRIEGALEILPTLFESYHKESTRLLSSSISKLQESLTSMCLEVGKIASEVSELSVSMKMSNIDRDLGRTYQSEL